jgi:hypothetical protein
MLYGGSSQFMAQLTEAMVIAVTGGMRAVGVTSLIK